MRMIDFYYATFCLNDISLFSYRRSVYGNNEIVIPVKSILTLLCLEVLNPFYVFQLFSFGLWVADNYYYYAMVILTMSSIGIIMAVFQTRRVRDFLFTPNLPFKLYR